MKVLINLIQTIACTVETYELAKGLVSNGVEVSLILSDHIENKNDWLESKDLFSKIYFVDTHISKKDFLSKTIKFIVSGRRKIKKFFKGESFDFLINTMGNYWDPFIPSLIRAKEIVTYIHDPIPHSGTKWWIKLIRNKRYKQADQIIVHTKSFIPIVHQLYGFPVNKIHFVPHGRLQRYNAVRKNNQIVDSFYVGRTNFIFFGYIQKYKGLHVLSSAYSIIYKKHKNVTLTIAGNGDFSDYKNEFDALENVRVINRRILDEEIGDLFSVPNGVSVLPYIDATQSGVIVTAMEFLTPILATDTGGLKEQLDDGKIGLMCKPNDPIAFANLMDKIIENTDEFAKQKQLMEEYLPSLNSDKIAKLLLEEITNEN